MHEGGCDKYLKKKNESTLRFKKKVFIKKYKKKLIILSHFHFFFSNAFYTCYIDVQAILGCTKEVGAYMLTLMHSVCSCSK